MRAGKLLLAISLLVPSVPLAAQVDSARAAPDSISARVLEHTFTTPSREFVRVRLVANEMYRVELSDGRVQLDIHPLEPGFQALKVRQRTDDEHSAVYEVEPRTTGEYEIRVLGAGAQKVRLTVDRFESQP
jgi:hypothetical protein